MKKKNTDIKKIIALQFILPVPLIKQQQNTARVLTTVDVFRSEQHPRIYFFMYFVFN